MDQTKWLTMDELFEYPKMGQTKLYRMAQNGEIPASGVRNQWRFGCEEIHELMKSRKLAAGKMSAGGTE